MKGLSDITYILIISKSQLMVREGLPNNRNHEYYKNKNILCKLFVWKNNNVYLRNYFSNLQRKLNKAIENVNQKYLK